MAEPPRDEQRERVSLGAELIMPALIVAFATYYVTTVWNMPWEANFAALCTVGALAVLLALLLVRHLRAWRAGLTTWDFDTLLRPRDLIWQRLLLIGASAAFILAMPYLGFTLSVFLFLLFMLTALAGRRHLRKVFAISLTFSLTGYAIFIGLIGIRFPAGPVEQLLMAAQWWRG